MEGHLRVAPAGSGRQSPQRFSAEKNSRARGRRAVERRPSIRCRELSELLRRPAFRADRESARGPVARGAVARGAVWHAVAPSRARHGSAETTSPGSCSASSGRARAIWCVPRPRHCRWWWVRSRTNSQSRTGKRLRGRRQPPPRRAQRRPSWPTPRCGITARAGPMPPEWGCGAVARRARRPRQLVARDCREPAVAWCARHSAPRPRAAAEPRAAWSCRARFGPRAPHRRPFCGGGGCRFAARPGGCCTVVTAITPWDIWRERSSQR